MKRTRRRLLARAPVLLPLALAACSGAPPVPPVPRAPGANLLLITIDTLRADALGAYGNSRVATPSLDRLAGAGVRFDHAHAHAVVTLPSHASILTGLYPFQHGVHDNAGFRLPEGLPTLATLLAGQGYRTGAFVGAFPLDVRFGLGRGFEVYDDRVGAAAGPADLAATERRADAVVAAATRWLEAIPAGQRWFLWVHLFDPHAPYAPPPPYDQRPAGDPYLGEVSWVDAALAPLLDGAAGAGRPPTLVAVTADHGEALGEHGERTHGVFAYQATLRVPLLLHLPGVLLPGVRGELVRHIDLLPTVLELLGVAAPAGLPGRSLVPLLAARDRDKAAPESYFEALAPFLTRGWAPLRGILSGHEKAIELPVPELYDLAADPRERNNLAAARPQRHAELMRALRALAGETATARPASEPPEVLERLRGLGYLGGAGGRSPSSRFTPADDPKELILLDEAVHRSVELAALGDLPGAAAALERALEVRPDFSLARARLAAVLHDQGRVAEAVVELERAIAGGVTSAAAVARLGDYLLELGRAEEAARLLQPYAQAESPDVAALNTLAIARATLGQSDEAARLFERVLAIDATSADALANLGAFELGRGAYPAARTWFERALAIEPALARAWNGLGVVQSHEGDVAGARHSWEQAIGFDPRDWETRYNLAMLLVRGGETAAAREHLLAFARGAPRDRYARDHAAVQRLLDRMR